MPVVFAILGALFIAGGVLAFITARAVTHELAGLVLLLIGFMLVATAAILARLWSINKTLRAIGENASITAGTSSSGDFEERRTRELAEKLARRP
ncbi:MAG: hypothetical protein ACOZDY_18505 [Pseudomonadota bacterium]